MIRVLIITIFLSLIFAACKSESKKLSLKESQTNTIDKMMPENKEPKFFIKDDEVNGLKIREVIPLDPKDETIYTFEWKEEEVTLEGEKEVKAYYLAEYNGEEHLKIIPGFDIRTETYVNIIREIIILNDAYKTEEGIGVNSTIGEFIKAYPNAKAYYTYVSDRFWLENENDQFQFVLSQDALNPDKYTNSDLEEVPLGNFDTDTKIVRIRHYDRNF